MKCKNCHKKMTGHPNKRFCSNKGIGNCKDLFHNEKNPRGYGLIDNERRQWEEDNYDPSWDAHKSS